jgi:hypothetical protein
MKNTVALLFAFLGIAAGFSQEDDRPENTGDNFSLEGALAFFKKSNSLEEFEKLINEKNNNVNNLDLNNDGDIDYITVDDIKEGDVHAIVLSTYLSENEKQDIATIGIEKTGQEKAVLQIEGDADLYAENTIVEPSETLETSNGGKGGPNIPVVNSKQIIINVWFWPSVQFIYAPVYVIWHSPWRWANHPRWWRPWRPYHYHVFYGYCANYRVQYHRVPVRRVVVAHNVYSPRRNHSNLVVQNRRGTPILRQNSRNQTATPRNSREKTSTSRIKNTNPTSTNSTIRTKNNTRTKSPSRANVPNRTNAPNRTKSGVRR